MPKYTVVCRGTLHLSKDNIVKTGAIIELSEKDAASLPEGTVELVKPEKPAEKVKP